MIELIGIICLMVLQALHVVHDYMKFKAHAKDLEYLKTSHEELKRNGRSGASTGEQNER